MHSSPGFFLPRWPLGSKSVKHQFARFIRTVNWHLIQLLLYHPSIVVVAAKLLSPFASIVSLIYYLAFYTLATLYCHALIGCSLYRNSNRGGHRQAVCVCVGERDLELKYGLLRKCGTTGDKDRQRGICRQYR